VIETLRKTIGAAPAETGAALGRSAGRDTIDHIWIDRRGRRSSATYSPDVDSLNAMLASDWNPRGVRLAGITHSHPRGVRAPSGGDERYAANILEAIPDLAELALPIIMSQADSGAFEFIPYRALRAPTGVRIESMKLQIEEAERQPRSTFPDAVASGAPATRWHPGAAFERVVDAYDLDRLHDSRVLVVGTGGSRSYVEDLARAGVGQFVLIDPDVVNETNIATQQVFRDEVGRLKVDALATAIHNINPVAKAFTHAKSLDDFDDETFHSLATAPAAPGDHPPLRTLIAGFTDSFLAQARINRLALKFGVPSICAQLYREGRALELTFTYPGVTKACHRCVLGSRYRAYDEGFTNDVGSHGTPIFATQRLNALKGIVTLAILHHGTEHPRWGALLERIGHRNLIQVRLDPDLGTSLGLTVFERVLGKADQDRLLCDETVWLPQDPEAPEFGFEPCLDCGGTGNLGDSEGRPADTRIFPVVGDAS